MKHRVVSVGVLVSFLMGLVPSSVWADANRKSQLVLVMGVTADNPTAISGTSRDKIANLIRNRFILEGFPVVSSSQTSEFIEKHISKKLPNDLTDKLREADVGIEKGRTLYNNASFEQAVVVLQEARKIYLDRIQYMTDNAPILNSYLFEGVSNLALGKKAQMRIAFEEILRFYPDIVLSNDIVSPAVVKVFEDIRSGLKAYDKTKLIVTSNVPDATIYLNGRKKTVLKEDDVLTVSDCIPGKYYIRATKDGYEDVFQTFVATKGEVKINISLAPSNPIQAFAPFRDAPSSDLKEQLSLFESTSGKSVDVVFLGDLSLEGDVYQLRGQLYGKKTGVFTDVYKIKIGGSLKNAGEGVDNLMKALMLHFGNDGILYAEVAPDKQPAEAPAPVAPTTAPDAQTAEDVAAAQTSDSSDVDTVDQDEDFAGSGTRAAIAWTILGALLIGASVGGYYFYQSQLGGAASVRIDPPAY